MLPQDDHRKYPDGLRYNPKFSCPEIMGAEVFTGRYPLFLRGRELVDGMEGDWAEFGVYKGKSARWLARMMPGTATLHAFDTFTGLPEPYEINHQWTMRRGKFACPTPDFKDLNVKLHVGLFSDTIPAMVDTARQLAFIHIDCDLYSSATDVFTLAGPRIAHGAFIQMDDLWGFEFWERQLWRAFQEWVDRESIKYKFVGRTETGQGAVRVYYR
jgi:hypothetical protein